MSRPTRSGSIAETRTATLVEALKMPQTVCTRLLLKAWLDFCTNASKQTQDKIQVKKQTSLGPKKILLVISISDYSPKPLKGSKTDWKFWAMIGKMAGWDVEILSDSFPAEYRNPKNYPSKQNIEHHLQNLVKGNSKGDQFIVAYSGHCNSQGLIMADGRQISQASLHDWLVRPLVTGSYLWGFFDCCESRNLLYLPYKAIYQQQSLLYGAFRDEPVVRRAQEGGGTVIVIGSSDGASGEVNISDESSTEELYAGPLTFQVYKFFHQLKNGEPLLSKFLPFIANHLAEGGQVAQVTTSEQLYEPTLPLLRASN